MPIDPRIALPLDLSLTYHPSAGLRGTSIAPLEHRERGGSAIGEQSSSEIDDADSVRFVDTGDCEFCPDAGGRIICAVHDHPLLAPMGAFDSPTDEPSACDLRKQWLQDGIATRGLDDNPTLLGLLRRQKLPAWLQIRILEHPDDRARWPIVQREDLAPEVQERLAQDRDTEIRVHLATREDLALTVMVQLARDDEAHVRDEIAKRLDLTSVLERRRQSEKDWLAGAVIAYQELLADSPSVRRSKRAGYNSGSIPRSSLDHSAVEHLSAALETKLVA